MIPSSPLRSVTMAIAVFAVLANVTLPATAGLAVDVEAVLSNVGERVRQYFQRAQSLVATETVQLQPIGSDLTSSVRSNVLHRRLVYELRVAWDPPSSPGDAPEANVMRRLVKVDGRTPRPKDEPACM